MICCCFPSLPTYFCNRKGVHGCDLLDRLESCVIEVTHHFQWQKRLIGQLTEVIVEYKTNHKKISNIKMLLDLN